MIFNGREAKCFGIIILLIDIPHKEYQDDGVMDYE